MPPPPPPPPGGHTCDVANAQKAYNDAVAAHNLLVEQLNSNRSQINPYIETFCVDPESQCCTDAKAWDHELDVFIFSKHRDWGGLREAAETALANIGHPSPPGCILRLGGALSAIHAMELHDQSMQQGYDNTFEPTFNEIADRCEIEPQ